MTKTTTTSALNSDIIVGFLTSVSVQSPLIRFGDGKIKCLWSSVVIQEFVQHGDIANQFYSILLSKTQYKICLILVFVAFLVGVLVMESVDNFIFSETQVNARFTAIPGVCSTSRYCKAVSNDILRTSNDHPQTTKKRRSSLCVWVFLFWWFILTKIMVENSIIMECQSCSKRNESNPTSTFKDPKGRCYGDTILL